MNKKSEVDEAIKIIVDAWEIEHAWAKSLVPLLATLEMREWFFLLNNFVKADVGKIDETISHVCSWSNEERRRGIWARTPIQS